MSSETNGDRSLRWLKRAVTVPYFWLLLFFVAPFLIILKISVADPIVAQPPFTPFFDWGAEGIEGIRATFANFAFLFQDGYYGIIYLASLKMAAIGTLLCLLLAAGLSRVDVRSLILRNYRARPNHERTQLREFCDYGIGKCEFVKVRIRVAAHVLERQYRDAFLIRTCRGYTQFRN